MASATPSIVLSYEQAAALVQRHAETIQARSPQVQQVSLIEAAGRVLAAPLPADRDQPPFPRSTRDGFACRAAEIHAGPLRIVGRLRAGEPWIHGPLVPGTAVEIMTGAAVPPGADCVVMIEHVQVADGMLSLSPSREIASGENIVPCGAEAHADDIVVPAGRRMGITEIAAAAACGRAEVSVFGKPRVAILSTGDELVDISEIPLPHQIRNSNSYSLAAQVSAAGATPVLFPIVPDDPHATEKAIAAAAECDLLLLTGGVSMGKFDFVEQALLACRAEFFFTGARIQPGKPVVFGKLPGSCFLGLPGNPISTIVTFALFAAPLLRALSGEAETQPRFVSATLETEVRVKPGLTRFLPARIESGIQGARIRQISWQGSGDLAAAARANAFLVVPETSGRLPQDSLVAALLI